MAKSKTVTKRVYLTKTTKRRRKKSFTIPVAVALPIATVGYEFYNDVNRWGFYEAARWLTAKFTGYYEQPNQPDWKLKHMKKGLLPVAVGYGVHKLAAQLGLNRALASTGLPWIRI